MRYNQRGYADLFINHSHWGPRSFRKANRPPVKGGRWNIRKVHLWGNLPKQKPWHAYSNGVAKRFNKTFDTHDEAVAYAQMVATAFADPTREKIAAVIDAWRPELAKNNPHWRENMIYKFQKPTRKEHHNA